MQEDLLVIHQEVWRNPSGGNEEGGVYVRQNRAFSSWAWLVFITCCGNRVLNAECSKLEKLTSEILNVDSEKLQVFEYLQPTIENEWVTHLVYTTHWVVYKNPNIFMAITPERLF